VLAAVAVPVALAGVPAGFGWSALAPRPLVVVTAHGAADLVNPETKAFIAADGWFLVLSVAGGLLSGVLAYRAAVRRHGWPAMAGLILGAVGAVLLAWWIGTSYGRAGFRSDLWLSNPGAILHAPLRIRAHGVLVFWPLAAALTAGAAELAGRRPTRTDRAQHGHGGQAAATVDLRNTSAP
jgi:hypothetical protein